MQRAWLFCERKRLGITAPWWVGWVDHDGAERSELVGPKKAAESLRKRLLLKLETGPDDSPIPKDWQSFWLEYQQKVLPTRKRRTAEEMVGIVAHVERILRPQVVDDINTGAIAKYVARRFTEPGRRRGTTVLAPSISKEVCLLRAILRVAYEWGYTKEIPESPPRLLRALTAYQREVASREAEADLQPRQEEVISDVDLPDWAAWV